MRRWTAASLLVIVPLYARATGQWAVAFGVAALLLTALALGARLALSPGWTRVATAAALAAGGALGWLVVPAADQPLRPPWPSFALAGLCAGAVMLCRADRSRSSGPALLPGLLALTACGEATLGPVYGVAAVVHLALALLALREGDLPKGPRPRLPRRSLAIAALLGTMAAAAAVGFALGLPPLSLWTEAWVLHGLGVEAKAGFSDKLVLGSLRGMLLSDEVVMRIEGPRADYLRGAVYDHYELGHWSRRRGHPGPVDALGWGAKAGGPRVRATLVSGERDRYFLPLDARAIDADGEALAADRFGVIFAASGTARRIAFSFGPPEMHGSIPVAEPGDEDLVVPPGLRGPLRRIANEWTAGAATPEAKVEAIAERLRTRFTYSLRYDHRRRPDMVLDFLLDDHKGHCEYFATALTLLARSVGVPARVAGGYRVTEQNPVGGYWVVRERNAHAWSEVFLPGRGFVTIDATPPDSAAGNTPHFQGYWSAVWDLVRAKVSQALDRLTLLHVVGGFAGIAVVGLVLRWLRRDRGPRATRARRHALEKPPPDLARLFAALARRGFERAHAEPLERFALRLDAAGLGSTAELLQRWAAFRYGGEGDGEALARELNACAQRLARGA